jgi:hypothetical protein
MNAAKVDRTQICGGQQARIRLRHAMLYMQVAEVALSEESAEHATVATGNAVLAGIAAADAICCAVSGTRYRGLDHRRAADHLEHVTADKQLAALLRDLIDLKDAGHYGLQDLSVARAKSAIRKAGKLVDAARDRVR